MSITIRKGEFPTIVLRFPSYPDTTGGSGTITVSGYGGSPTIFSVALSLHDSNTALAAPFTATEMNLLEAQTAYSCTSDVVLPTYGVNVTHVSTLNVSAETAIQADMTRLYGKIIKPDGTPAGSMKRVPVATQDGIVLTSVWGGVTITAKHIPSTEFQDSIVGIESVITMSDAAGLFELYVLKGITVAVSCNSFGKTVTVDTTGLDAIDLSDFF